jgi:hypothetical protein
MARAQLFEHAMVKLLEVQRHDLAVPLEPRWAEISQWLMAPAGTTSRRPNIPERIRADLKAIVDCRNSVAHASYRGYVAAREKRGARAVDAWTEWFDEQISKLGVAYNGVMSITAAVRDGSLNDDALTRERRKWVTEPVAPLSFPPTAAASSAPSS